MKKTLTRAAAVILRDGAVAMIERRRPQETYLLFPGGRVEPGETYRQTVVREVLEELGLQVAVGRLVAEVVYRGQAQRFYLATVTGGEFGAGTGPEFGPADADDGEFVPVWVPLDELVTRPTHPQAVARMVAAGGDGRWPAKPLRLVDEGRVSRRGAA